MTVVKYFGEEFTMAGLLRRNFNKLFNGHSKVVLIAAALLVAFMQCSAQHFKYEASVQKVDSDGFYAINITPDVSRYIKTDFSDIHVMDNHNKQMPFIIKSASIKDAFIATPPLSFVQNDSSDKCTYITVINEHFYHVEKIELTVDAHKFAKRKVTISNVNTSLDFELEPDTLNSFSLPAFNTKKFIIKIENGNNAPLAIKSITIYQAAHELITYLDADKSYTLYMGDVGMQIPSSEGKSFKESIPPQIKSLAIGEIKPVQHSTTENKKSFFSNNTRFWVTSVIVLIVLLFFTLKLIKQRKKA